MFITVLMIKSTKRSVGVCHVITVTIVVDMNTHVHGLSYFLSPGTVIEKKKSLHVIKTFKDWTTFNELTFDKRQLVKWRRKGGKPVRGVYYLSLEVTEKPGQIWMRLHWTIDFEPVRHQ